MSTPSHESMGGLPPAEAGVPACDPFGRARQAGRWLALGLLLLALAMGSTLVWYRQELAEARRLLALGRYEAARDRLARLDWIWSNPAELAYPLGVCEQAMGRIEEAAAAWARVPSTAPEAAPALLERARIEVDRGRFADAETILVAALAGPAGRSPEFGGPMRHELIQILYREGRLDEVPPLIEQMWESARREAGPGSPPALAALQAHRTLDLEAYPITRVAGELTEAARLAPADPRVWLGQARLAIRTGAIAEARGWIERCLTCGVVDAPVWRAALDLALVADDRRLALSAIEHLRASDLLPRRIAALRVAFARLRGDRDAERRALDERLATQPSDVQALERRAELAAVAGDTGLTESLRRRKTEIDATLRDYVNRLEDPTVVARAATLASQAETIGRWFEARAWLLLAAGGTRNPELDARLRSAESAWHAERSTPSDEPLLARIGPVAPDATGPEPEKGPNLSFVERAESAGLRFRFENGQTPQRQLPETMSGGVGLIDYDGDGWLDVYCVQGGPFPPPDPVPPGARSDRLFRNRGDGSFEDVSESTGIARLVHGYGQGLAVGDLDNDGRSDLILTRWRGYQVLRNTGQGFEDVTKAWGLEGDRDWPTSAALADLDNDGDLDLYVCHYIDWDPVHPRICLANETPRDAEPGANDSTHGTPRLPQYCAPHVLGHTVDHCFRNEGGRFVDVTQEAGFVDRDGRGLGVLAADLDGDRRIDLFVANDGTANTFHRNLGGFRFEEGAMVAGLAANGEGGFQAGMGIAGGDVDGDGRLDLVVTNFYGESTTLFQSIGPGLYGDFSSRAGLRAATRYRLGFGTVLADLDNDGWLDLATANGHVNDSRPVIPYAMPMQLLRGRPNGRFIDESDRSGPAWALPRVGRGLAAGDLDHDGRVDLVAVDQAGPLVMLQNRSTGVPGAAHFLTISLEGTISNRDAVGAVVEVEAGGRRWTLTRMGGGSYLSAHDPRLHVGLGAAERIDSVEVRWPSGRVERILNLSVDRGYHLVEGSGLARPLKGFSPTVSSSTTTLTPSSSPR